MPGNAHHRLQGLVETAVIPIFRLCMNFAGGIPFFNLFFHLFRRKMFDLQESFNLFRRHIGQILYGFISHVFQLRMYIAPICFLPFIAACAAPPGAGCFRLPPTLLFVAAGRHK